MKNQYFQQIRGLCIIVVVLIHLPIGLSSGESSFLWMGVRQIINFPVATFIFLSAFFCKCDKGLGEWYSDRLKRLVVPYLIWGAFYLFLLPYARDGHIADDTLFRLIAGYGPAYFLVVLVQLTIITPIIVKYKNNRVFRIISWMITPVYILFYYLMLFRYDIEIPSFQTLFMAWYIFYFVGIVYRDSISAIGSRLGNISLTFFILLALLLSFVESYIILDEKYAYSFAISQLKISSILYSLLVIVYFINNISINAGRNWLSQIGDYSMGIFMLHPFYNWCFKFVFIHVFNDVYNSFPGITIIHSLVLLCSIISGSTDIVRG